MALLSFSRMMPQVNLSARPIHIIVGFRPTGKPGNGPGAGQYFFRTRTAHESPVS
jgi:hypothetical protein